MAIKNQIIAVTVFLSAAILLISAPVFADLQDFTIKNFNADYYLNQTNPHGHMRVVEKIDVEFTDNNHGILRAVPDSYDGHQLHVRNIKTTKADGTSWPFTTYSSANNLVIKIGDLDKTVIGPNTFIVEYEIDGPITFYDGYDELFWDVNGDQWAQPAEQVTAKLHLDSKLTSALKEQKKCFSGSFGSIAESCSISTEVNNSGTIITFSASDLGPYETLSFVTAFNKGTFVPYDWQDELKEHTGDIILISLMTFLLALAFRQWWLKGKDYKGSGTIIPEYAPPKGIDVLGAGILQDFNLDNRDITAAIIGLAVKGYITIIEEDKKQYMLFKSTRYSLKLNHTDTTKLNEYESRLIKAIFDPFEKDKTIKLGTYDSKLQKETVKIGEDLTEKLTKDGYFEENPKKAAKVSMFLILVACIGLIILSFVLGAVLAGIFGILAVILIIIFLALMPRRSRYGVATHEQLKGLKLYIQTAEKDRINLMQSPNAKYAKNAREPKRTVELFEKLLPFAIVFGVEKQWAKQFESLYTNPPEWYSGNYSTFNSVILTNHIMSSTSAMNASFAPPSSSGGSGFSGGGGAGGGGGGGGGGGW